MTRVDFYLLASDQIQQRHLFACRLVEKAFRLGNQVYIHSDDDSQARQLDQLLWSFRNSSFLPHHIEEETAGDAASIQIGYGLAEHTVADHNGVLINLSQSVPEFFSRFERVSEIVVQDELITRVTRANFRFYRDRGYPLETHDLRDRLKQPTS